MWIIKLGGSWINNPKLDYLVRKLCFYKDSKICLVLGGGVFADSVRYAQKKMNFDDTFAHSLAIKATENFGYCLKRINPNIQLTRNFEKLFSGKKLKVWLPYNFLKNEPSIKKNWNSTSDTIASWLCNRLGADGIVYIKSLEFKHKKKIKLHFLKKKNILDTNAQTFFKKKMKLKIVGPEIIDIVDSRKKWSDILNEITEIMI